MSRDVQRILVVGALIAVVGLASAAGSPIVVTGLAELGFLIDPLRGALLVAALGAFLVSQAAIMLRFGAAAEGPVARGRLDVVWLAVPTVLLLAVVGWTVLQRAGT